MVTTCSKVACEEPTAQQSLAVVQAADLRTLPPPTLGLGTIFQVVVSPALTGGQTTPMSVMATAAASIAPRLRRTASGGCPWQTACTVRGTAWATCADLLPPR